MLSKNIWQIISILSSQIVILEFYYILPELLEFSVSRHKALADFASLKLFDFFSSPLSELAYFTR